MISSITLDDANGIPVTLHYSAKREVIEAHGLLGGGVAPPRDSRRVKPQAHGGIDETKYTDGQLIALTLNAFSNVSLEDAFSEYRAMVKPMYETLAAPALLKWTEATGGLALQRLVKLASDVDPPLTDNAAILTFQAQFFSEDPRAYSQTLTTVTGDALLSASGGMTFPVTFPFTFATSGGGTANVANAGGKSTPPVLRVYGYQKNPIITNLDTGDAIVLGTDSVVAEIGSGDYLEIDVAARTLKVNGDTSRRNFLNTAETTWFELPANTTTHLQNTAGDHDGSARMDVLFRSAY